MRRVQVERQGKTTRPSVVAGRVRAIYSKGLSKSEIASSIEIGRTSIRRSEERTAGRAVIAQS